MGEKEVKEDYQNWNAPKTGESELSSSDAEEAIKAAEEIIERKTPYQELRESKWAIKDHPKTKTAEAFNETSGKVMYLLLKHPELERDANGRERDWQEGLEIWNKLGLGPEIDPKNPWEKDQYERPTIDKYGEKFQFTIALRHASLIFSPAVSVAGVTRWRLGEEIQLNTGGRVPLGDRIYGATDFINVVKRDLLHSSVSAADKIRNLKEKRNPSDLGRPHNPETSYGMDYTQWQRLSDDEKIDLEIKRLEMFEEDMENTRKMELVSVLRGFGEEALDNNDPTTALQAFTESGEIDNPEIRLFFGNRIVAMLESKDPLVVQKARPVAEKLGIHY